MRLERDLSPPVRAWLNGRGLTAYAEVPASYNVVDFIGFDGERLVSVEMKKTLTRDVLRQAMRCQIFAIEAWCIVWSRPRESGIALAKKHLLGVAHVGSEGKIVIDLPAAESPHVNKFYREKVIHRLQAHPKDGDGGIRCMKGEGPAKRVGKALCDYFAANPRASWERAWLDVPNHYAHSRSMAQHHRYARETT